MSILPVYLIIGVVLFFVMRAMGKLLLSNFQYKSLIDFSTDLLGPWAGLLWWPIPMTNHTCRGLATALG